MIKLIATLIIISLLGLSPIVVEVAGHGRTEEQDAEQRRLPTTDQIQPAQERLKAESLDPGRVTGVLNPPN
jgi:hypothetical protein